MPQVNSQDIHRRASALREVGRKQYEKLLRFNLNKHDEILLEKSNQGYLRNFIRVNLLHKELLPSGILRKVKITKIQTKEKKLPVAIAELVE